MQFGTIDERPEFVAYWNGLKDRPGRLVADRFMREAMEASGHG
jgi:glutathione S-transferase